jgi:Protein of unknown function (DUF1585)
VYRLSFVCLIAFVLSATGDAYAAPQGGRSLAEYRHFRAAAIDLLGRMPNREDLAEFERPDFEMDRWIDKHLGEATYARRMTRVYMDLLRLEPNLTFGYMPWQLYRYEVQGPDGPVYVYWRENERRAREETDMEFCLSSDEIGQIVRVRAAPIGTPKPVSREAFERATVLVKPWWLYKDYRAHDPHERYGEGWAKPDPQYQVADSLLKEPDGKPTEQIRICREEAQAAETGHIYASGRKRPPPPPKGEKPEKAKPGELPPGGRYRPPPLDSAYAVQHKGEPVACASRLAIDMSIDCGCGTALERCLPADGDGQGSSAFNLPNHEPLGESMPLDSARQPAQHWFPYWWSVEAVRFLDHLFASDADFREILTGKGTSVNGPLAQFYRTIQRSNCCKQELPFNMTEETEPLFDPAKAPADLLPHDASVWKPVADRGPHAAGILTLPIFLEKFASARSRAAALYSAFLCKSFVSENAKLTPSTEPNLMFRPGCANCHATLEPLAAYFTRVEPSSFTYLPASFFPVKDANCKKDAKGKLISFCDAFYDPAFSDSAGALLRSAYGSPTHAEEGPAGMARDLVSSPDFASCAVDHVTASLLGRPTTPSDAALLESLTKAFTSSGYKMKSVVKGVLVSDAYKHANHLASAKEEGGP